MTLFLLLSCTSGGVTLQTDTAKDTPPGDDTAPETSDSSEPAGESGERDTEQGDDTASHDTAPSADSDDSSGPSESSLGDYVPSGEASTVTTISSNLSGVTWNASRGTYMVVRDSSAKLHEFDDTFTELRVIDLQNLDEVDTEDLVWLGSSGTQSTYALVTETGVLYIGSVTDEADALDMGAFQRITYAPEPTQRNKGGEGVGYDPKTQTFWVCIEKDPMTIYTFAKPPGTADTSFDDGLIVSEPFSAEERLGDTISDISSCGFDSRTGRLLILSHESRVLLDVDLEGTILDRLDIDIDAGDGSKAEGFAFDDAERLLVVGEPNSYRFYENTGG